MEKTAKHPPILRLAVLLLVSFLFAPTLSAKIGVYEKPSNFLKRHFKKIPKTQLRTLSSTDLKALKKILGHNYAQKRIRFWKVGDKTAWILEEIGKTEPITTGFIIRKVTTKKGTRYNMLSEIKVLVYRESHGSEVSRPFFTKQFIGSYRKGYRLNRKIDGIVGATLSARALTKLSAAALYLSDSAKK